MHIPSPASPGVASLPSKALGSRYVPRESSPPAYVQRRTWPPCPRHRGRSVRTSSGRLVPARCERVSCWACVVPVAIRTGEALAMARPSLAITLTRLPRSWEPVQKLMSRFSKTVRRRGISARYAYNLEPNPNDRTGAHCHLWWRGDPVNQPLLSEIAAIAGMGSHVDVRPARAETVHHAIPTIDYGLKQILRDRPEHPAELWPSAREYLDLNGGRLTHQTHGFWEDWLGVPIEGGVRRARQLAHGWESPPAVGPSA